MPIPPLRPIRPGGQLSASELNRLQKQAEASARPSAAGRNLLVRQGPAGVQHVDTTPWSGWALTTGAPGAGAAYPWQQAIDQGVGASPQFVVDPNGRSGTASSNPAVPSNGDTTLAVSTPIFLHLAPTQDHYIFAPPVGVGGSGNSALYVQDSLQNIPRVKVDDYLLVDYGTMGVQAGTVPPPDADAGKPTAGIRVGFKEFGYAPLAANWTVPTNGRWNVSPYTLLLPNPGLYLLSGRFFIQAAFTGDGPASLGLRLQLYSPGPPAAGTVDGNGSPVPGLIHPPGWFGFVNGSAVSVSVPAADGFEGTLTMPMMLCNTGGTANVYAVLEGLVDPLPAWSLSIVSQDLSGDSVTPYDSGLSWIRIS